MFDEDFHPERIKGLYPLRDDTRGGRMAQAWQATRGVFKQKLMCHPARFRWIVSRAGALEGELSALDDDGILRAAESLRSQFALHGLRRDTVARAFAVAREAATRRLGQRPFDTQLIGGLVLLSGKTAEMATGEGKTLAATLPAITVALAGAPVHIVTVNDYLARRDAEAMRPVYAAMGLTVGAVVSGMSREERRAAYGCDVTYCTNKELVFDYLKDWLLLGERPTELLLYLKRLYGKNNQGSLPLLRGLVFAIVDEADSVFIDEARTPLIMSGAPHGNDEPQMVRQALKLAGHLERDNDFELDERERKVSLTDAGKIKIAGLAEGWGGPWAASRWRDELARQALSALYLFHRDRHYLVRDQKIEIVDEHTGRVMPGRSWSKGMHQLIEAKEDCPITRRRETIAKISYQRFFPRYRQLAGMTGTASEVSRELWSVYRLNVVKVPTEKPLHRTRWRDRVLRTQKEKWECIVARVGSIHATGRPVLIGTRTVAASEALSEQLRAVNLRHNVLNAKQDEHEAAVIAGAGQPGAITVATNMAGRGTDIRLGDSVADDGGLHVILTERHEAKRIDRQLIGRCARQGDPGSYELILSLEDELLTAERGGLVSWLVARGAAVHRLPAELWGGFLLAWAQRRIEALHSRMRRELLHVDHQLGDLLAFTGKLE